MVIRITLIAIYYSILRDWSVLVTFCWLDVFHRQPSSATPLSDQPGTDIQHIQHTNSCQIGFGLSPTINNNYCQCRSPHHHLNHITIFTIGHHSHEGVRVSEYCDPTGAEDDNVGSHQSSPSVHHFQGQFHLVLTWWVSNLWASLLHHSGMCLNWGQVVWSPQIPENDMKKSRLQLLLFVPCTLDWIFVRQRVHCFHWWFQHLMIPVF